MNSITHYFADVSLQKNSTNEGSYLIVLEPVSVSVTVEVTPDLLNIMVLIGEDSLKGETYNTIIKYYFCAIYKLMILQSIGDFYVW